MKEIVSERRMYAGYPVFLITYFDVDNNRYNYSTISSMYTLGDMAVIGLGNNNTKKCILESKNFSISFLSFEYLKDMEIGGELGENVDKFKDSNLTLESLDDFKYIKQAELVYDVTFIENLESVAYPKFANFICRLNKVYAKDSLANNGVLDVNNYKPTILIGTDKGIFFRTI